MKPLLLVLTLFCLLQTTFAQNDSAHFDLGRLRLKKDFTQATVIRAEDIARLPFLNLSEIIRSWANGGLTDKRGMMYVVDGITVTDIDAYNIEDIEDITIIRNALVNQNGAGNMQLLAVVRTRQRTQTSPRIRISAMGGALDRKATRQTSTNRQQTEKAFAGNYQQFALSAMGGNEHFSYGGSLAFLHDALSNGKTRDSLYDERTPGINRVKLNLWGRYRINQNNILAVHFNYTPQFESGDIRMIMSNRNLTNTWKGQEHIINPSISWETKAAGWLQNKFSFSYINGRLLDSTGLSQDFSGMVGHTNTVDSLRSELFTFNDQLSFQVKAGNWLIEPGVNINFQKAYYRRAGAAKHYYEGDILGGSQSWSMQRNSGKLLTATPSFSISYGSLLLLQGGVLLDGSKLVDSMYRDTRSYPFVNGAFNLSQLLKSEPVFGWKLYASYAERFSTFDAIYQLGDFNYSFVQPPALEPRAVFIGSGVRAPSANRLATQWQLGTSFSLLANKLKVHYNYSDAEQSQRIAIRTGSDPWIVTRYFYGRYARRQHHIGIESDIVSGEELRWSSRLYVNVLKNNSTYDDFDFVSNVVYKEAPVSGGLVNRVQFGNFYTGIDLVYLLKQETRTVSLNEVVTKEHNTIQLGNIYFAYAFKVKRMGTIDLFVNGRNWIDSATYPLSPGNKKYFGGGFSVSL